MRLSVVIPCYNEEAVLETTHQRLSAVLSPLTEFEHEVLYIDDGSRDRTPQVLRELQQRDPAVRVLGLSRNFGHQIALTAGLHHVSGDVIVVIDADLQDPPELIPAMLAKWREGYQVVYGVRTSREGETAFKLWTASLFYRIINSVSEVQIPRDTGDFRLMDRCVVEALNRMHEHYRFVRGMVSWVGFRQTPFHYERHARFAGETKYPLRKMIRFAADAIVSFSNVPLRFLTTIGLLCFVLSFLGILYVLSIRIFTERWVAGWATVVIPLLFFGGLQLSALGIIGEYVGRIYGEVKARPLYNVAERLGFEPELASTGRHHSRTPYAGSSDYR